MKDLHEDPDRLRMPQRRSAAGRQEADWHQTSWHQIDWHQALDEVADRLVQIRQQHGPDSIAFYLGNPITHGWGPIILVPMLLAALGTRQRYSAASVDQQPQHLTSLLLYGSPLLLPVPDIDRTELLMVFGGNPMVSNGSIMTAPNIRRRLQDLRARGGRLVVVDPRRTITAEHADRHVFIRPGTDVYLLAAMANVIWSEGLARPEPSYVHGMAEVLTALAPCTPEAASLVTGVDADTIRSLARELATATRAAVYARLGVCQSQYGTTAVWLVHLLNIMTGRLDAPGGWMLARPAFDLPVIGARTTDLIGYDRWRSRLHQIPEVAAEFPTVTLADEILTPGPGQIRALVMIAGNPVLSVPDGRHLDQALADLEYCVSIDYYRNESNRHADVILPPTTVLEREEFDLVFPAVSVRNQVRWGPA
ncbi:MAG: molybdopterin-dependent oxidoreductase, partial [Actinomycetales bacterium]